MSHPSHATFCIGIPHACAWEHIAITWALLHNPKVLLLDEATAAHLLVHGP
jgi:hypothetical protein